jgi:fermentation-respiration switch protein FrsA (DUF1100 family)
VLLCTLALAALATYQGSPRGFADRKGHLTSADLRPAGEDPVSRLWEFTLRSSTGLEVRGLLRVPWEARPPLPAAVLVGGVKRGSRIVTVAGLEPIARQAIVASPDYPPDVRRGPRSGRDLIRAIFRLRPAALDTVAGILLLLDYLESRPDVERQRLFLVGGSMGGLVVPIAGGVDGRPAAVIALYGGARVASLVAHALQHPGQRVPLSHRSALLAGHALRLLLLPLAPERYAPAIAPRPLLMVNGSEDSLVPRASALALYEAARPPKELIWVRSEHVGPSEAELLSELAGIVTGWLVTQGLVPTGPS